MSLLYTSILTHAFLESMVNTYHQTQNECFCLNLVKFNVILIWIWVAEGLRSLNSDHKPTTTYPDTHLKCVWFPDTYPRAGVSPARSL